MAEPLANDHALAASYVGTIYNLTCTLAGTEYTLSLGNQVRQFSIRPRTSIHTLKFSFTAGASGTTYVTVGSGGYWEPNIGVSSLTLYVQSPDAGAVAEVVAWK